MTKYMEWLLEGNRLMALFGLFHWAVGCVQRAGGEKIEGVLFMILGVLIVLLAKVTAPTHKGISE